MITRRQILTLGLGALLALASWPVTGPASTHAHGARAGTPVWVRWDPSTKTANVTLVAAYNEVNAGYNFDGYNLGHLTITVPTGAKVVVAFTNKAEVPHSAVITPFAKRTLADNFPLAFPGSSTPNPLQGAAKVKTPQTFSFVANKAGTYAIVCGVPGHAIGGMWDVLQVANVPTATVETAGSSATGAPVVTKPIAGGGSTGALEGTVTDATSGKPIPHVFVVLGWTTLKRVGETDARGHYRIDHVTPVGLVDAYGFAQGYVYYHGHPIPIKAGRATEYSFKMPRQTFPKALLPTIAGATVSKSAAATGDSVTFQARITPGKGGPMSAEDFAVNGTLGISVLLSHVGGDVYRGVWQVPSGVKPGAYDFAIFGAMENCLENDPYQHVSLTIKG